MNSEFVFKPSKRFIFKIDSPKEIPIKKKLKIPKNSKNYFTIKPVKSFKRFQEKSSNSGIDPLHIFMNFNEKDPIYPYNFRKSLVYNKYYNKFYTESNKHNFNSNSLVGKKIKYKPLFTDNDNSKIKNKIINLSRNDINIKNQKMAKSLGKNNYPFLNMKSEIGPNLESDSFWIPKINSEFSLSNKSSVDYNIINHKDNHHRKSDNFFIGNKFINNKKKGISEFYDYLRPYISNSNKKYLKCLENNKDRFHYYKGIFSEMYDSAVKNGNLYLPYRKRYKK